MKIFFSTIVAFHAALLFTSCQRIKIGEINIPFTISFEAPAASDEKAFEYELALKATDYPEFNNNKERLENLSLTAATLLVNEVRLGEGTVVDLSLYVSDSTRNHLFLTELKNYELRADNTPRNLPLNENAKNRMVEWLRLAPHKVNLKILGSADSIPYDASFRFNIDFNQKIKVLI